MRYWDDILFGVKRRLWFLHRNYKHFGRYAVIDRPYILHGKKYISIGDWSFIRKGARIEVIDTWNDQKFSPILKIEEGVSFEQYLHLTCAGKITIGKKTTINANVLITDIIHEDNVVDESILNQKLRVKPVCIGENCFIGKNVCIMPGVTIGDYVTVGANAVVTKDIPSYYVAAGVPARLIREKKH